MQKDNLLVNSSKDYIVFIYKREIFKEDTLESHSYALSDIVCGNVILENDIPIFIDEYSNKYPFISDVNSLDSDFVFAFPFKVDIEKENINDKLNLIKDDIEDLRYYFLFQIYVQGEEKIDTYCIYEDNKNNYNYINIDPTDMESIYSVSLLSCEDDEYDDNVVEERKPIYANEIYDSVRKTVLFQDKQIKSIAASISKNQRITDAHLKDNLLICGPTGVGKSEIFRCISRDANIPVIMEDSTEYTASGYKGKDLTDMLYHLYLESGKNIKKAERGIIIIDEIDKKISKNDDLEVYTKAVLDSILKMAEGHIYHVENKDCVFDIDTSFITFVMLGAFSKIEEHSEKRRTVGFMTEEDKKEQEKTENIYTEHSLLKYGVKPEFLGRTKVIVMNSLGKDEFAEIIENSDKSQLKLYKYLLDDLGIKLLYDKSTIDAISKKASDLGLGARSIKKIIEKSFEMINYEIFSNNKYSELVITPETIEDNTKFILR